MKCLLIIKSKRKLLIEEEAFHGCKKLKSVTLAQYIYNKKNQVTKFTDGKSGETTEYCYDCNGNTLYKYLISENGKLLRVVEGDTEKTTVNGSMRTITSGTDDSGKSYVQNGNAKITSDTDEK